jgi:serine protease Do
MFAANESGSARRGAGFLPYFYGGVTGAAVGLVVILAVLIARSPDGTAQHALTGNDDFRPVPVSTPLDVSRRNAIVLATEQVAPAVVSIEATFTRRTRPVFDSFWRRYYPSRTRTFSNQGSGVIVDPSGYIFTNYHVVQRAERLTVTTYDGETYSAEITYVAPGFDLALLKIPGDSFHAAPIGDSDELMVGEWAIAIGSPFGTYLADKQPTVTVGVISANHRDIKQAQDSEQVFNDMIQTDAAINPGNSGGPLVNSNGEVIGINTVIFSGGTGANIGMGFAIPVNRAWLMFTEVKEYGRLRKVTLGMVATDITPELAVALDLPSRSGVLVRSIEEGGPADEAGIKPGDQILAVNGIQVQNTDHANRLIFGSRVGDVLEITINRDDEILSFQVELAERPSDI